MKRAAKILQKVRSLAARRPPLNALAVLLALGVLVPLWSGYAWLTVEERADAIADVNADMAAFAGANADFASVLLAGRDGEHLEMRHPPAWFREKMETFRKVAPPPENAALHVTLDRIAPHALVGDAEIAAPRKFAQDGWLTVIATRPSTGFVSTVRISEADAIADWRRGAIGEGIGLLFISLLICALVLVLVRLVGAFARSQGSGGSRQSRQVGLSRQYES